MFLENFILIFINKLIQNKQFIIFLIIFIIIINIIIFLSNICCGETSASNLFILFIIITEYKFYSKIICIKNKTIIQISNILFK